MPFRLARRPTGRPWIVAHRGASASHPENTLAAFRAAVDAGADMVEMDVHLSADRVPVVLHDDRLERTTNGSGAVRDRPAAALADLDAGSWFDPRFAGERVPTLRAALEEVAHRVPVNVELKARAYEARPAGPPLESLVRDLVAQLGLERRVLVSTSEPRFFRRMGGQGVLTRARVASRPPRRASALAAWRRQGIELCHPRAGHVRREDVGTLHAAGLAVIPWTVDDADLARRLAGWGADGLFTNDPRALCEALEEWATRRGDE